MTGTLADTTDVINSGVYDVDATDTIQSLRGQDQLNWRYYYFDYRRLRD